MSTTQSLPASDTTKRICIDCNCLLAANESSQCVDCHTEGNTHERFCPACRNVWSLEYEEDGNTVAQSTDTTCPACGEEDAKTWKQARAGLNTERAS